MAITLIASTSATPGIDGGTTTAINTTGATLIVLSLSTYGAAAAPTVSDSKGNVYIPLTARLATDVRHQIYYCVLPAVGTGHTVTVFGVGARPAIFVYAFAGAGAFQVETGATSAGTASLASGSMTPSAAGALIVSGVCGRTAVTDSITPSGFTLATRPFVTGVNLGGSAAWQVQGTAAAINPTWGFAPAQTNTAVGSVVFLAGVPAVGFVNASSGQIYDGTPQTQISISPTIAVTTGNLIVVCVRGANCTGVIDTTIGGTSTYTLRATDPAGTLRIFSAANVTGSAALGIQAQFSPATAYLSIVALQFSGAATSSELVGAFTTPEVISGTTIDAAYHTGGLPDTIVVGLADVFASGPFSFAAAGTSGSLAPYVEPVLDHPSASFFYRLPAAVLAADTVRATCTTSGVAKHLLVAVFRSGGAPAIEVDATIPIAIGLTSTATGPDVEAVGVLVELGLGGSYRTWLRRRGAVRHWFLGEPWGPAAFNDVAAPPTTGAGTYSLAEPAPVTRGLLPEYGLASAFNADQAVSVPSGLPGTGGPLSIVVLVRLGTGGLGGLQTIYATAPGGAWLGLLAGGVPAFGVQGGAVVTAATPLGSGQDYLVVGTVDGGGAATLYTAQLVPGAPVSVAGPTAIGAFAGAHGAGVVGSALVGALQGLAEVPAVLTLAEVTALQAAGVWTDVTPDVEGTTPLVVDHGIHDDAPTARLARSSTCTFALDNSHLNTAGLLGYYSPPHPNARPGFDRNTPVRVTLAHGGQARIQFLGTIRSITPEAGVYRGRSTALVCTDWLDEAAKAPLSGLPTQIDLTADALIRVLVDAMRNRPHALALETAGEIYPYVLDSAQDEQSTVQGELLRATMSELGLLYMRSDGTLRFEARSTRGRTGTVSHVLDELLAAAPQRSTDQIVNRVKVTVHPRRVDPDTTTVLYQSEGPIRVDNGVDVEIFLAFRDPGAEATRIGAVTVPTPTPGVDYTVSVHEDGTGAVTGHPAIGITWKPGGNGMYLQVDNGYGQPVYVQDLTIHGQGLYDYAPVTLIAEDLDSIAVDGMQEVSIDMPYSARASVGQAAAELLLQTFTATPTRVDTVDWYLFTSAATLAAGIQSEVSSRVQVVEDVTGIEDEYFINAKRITWRPADDIDVTVWLTPATTAVLGWVLETSRLDVDTRLGY